MQTKTYLRIGGSIVLFFAVFHILSPQIVSAIYSEPLVNGRGKSVMHIYTYLTALICLGMSLITFISGSELVLTRPGRFVLIYFASIGLFRALLGVIFTGITSSLSVFVIVTTSTAGLCYILAVKKAISG